MSDSICNDAAYQNMIIQKKRFQLMNIPPVRYNNLANNPYERINPETSKKFTKLDLDMRRKVEVLKYNANNSSTQTNRFTKAEIYAQVVSGKYQQRTYSNSFIIDNTVNNQINACPSIKTPTTSCGVPGPVIYLYEDNNVPLYNYTTNIDANYGILTQGDNPYGKTWDYVKLLNINNIQSNPVITSLYIYYMDAPIKTFTITTPIAISFEGTKSSGPNPNVTFKIRSISTNILYNNTTYTTIQSNNHNYPTNEITVNPIGSIGSIFSGTCYFGLMTITNIAVPIQKGFIYDIQTGIDYTITNTSISVTTLNTIFNISSDFSRKSTNCNITGDVNPVGLIPDMTVSSS